MSRKFFFYLFAVVALFSSIALGDSPAYSLLDCFQLALTRSSLLADQGEQIEQAEQHYQQALGSSMPNISGALSMGAQHLTSGKDPLATQALGKVTYSQSLFNGFRMMNAITQARELITAQKHAKDWVAYQLYSDVAQAYYLRLYLLQDRQLLQEQQRLYEERLNELKARYQIGRTKASDVWSFEASLSQLKAQMVLLDQQIKASATLLYFLTGLDSTTRLVAVDTTTAPLKSLAEFKYRITRRPDVMAAHSKLDSLLAVQKVAQGAQQPSIDLSTNYYFLHTTTGAQRYSDWDGQIMLSLPFFNGGVISSKIDEAASQVRQVEFAITNLQRQIEEQIDDLYHALQCESTQLEFLTQSYHYSMRAVSTLEQDYRNGLSTNLDVLQAMNSYVDAKRALNKLQYAYKTDFARLTAAAVDIQLPGDK